MYSRKGKTSFTPTSQPSPQTFDNQLRSQQTETPQENIQAELEWKSEDGWFEWTVEWGRWTKPVQCRIRLLKRLNISISRVFYLTFNFIIWRVNSTKCNRKKYGNVKELLNSLKNEEIKVKKKYSRQKMYWLFSSEEQNKCVISFRKFDI